MDWRNNFLAFDEYMLQTSSLTHGRRVIYQKTIGEHATQAMEVWNLKKHIIATETAEYAVTVLLQTPFWYGRTSPAEQLGRKFQATLVAWLTDDVSTRDQKWNRSLMYKKYKVLFFSAEFCWSACPTTGDVYHFLLFFRYQQSTVRIDFAEKRHRHYAWRRDKVIETAAGKW